MITCIREAWVEKSGEHYVEYHYLCDGCLGTTITPDPTPHCASAECRQPSDESTRLRTLAEAATRLVATLPRCDWCSEVATRQERRDGGRYCEAHSPCIRELPYAPALRDTIAALAALDKAPT